MFQSILIPVDSTDFSDKAMNEAIDLAAEHHAKLVALKVVPRYAMNYFDGMAAFSPAEIASAEARSVGAAQQTLQVFVELAEANGVRLTTAIAISDCVADAIVGAAVKHGSDLIVMASHRRSGFARLAIGSKTDQVLAHSKVPVLVIR
ncbi:universal stress protein UspE (plasmid) [Variovorax sp. SRS16]|uniref:universal stress protein n=1 Tax=Variovorax sp. SRS16 TaxID=282217 RepID=UPI0013190F1B|nr:universal stress protein [Variovorax sp. SRS16]VTU45427.1 universal stress protein UspE [Variovorax sp. SRS16]